MKRIAILGSSGSIGQNTLDVIKKHPEEFSVYALAANSNIAILSNQIRQFHPKVVAVADEKAALLLEKKFAKKVKIFAGEEGIEHLAKDKQIDLLVLAISGSAALMPLVRAVEAGRQVALANKESLVMAGKIIMNKAERHHAKIIPIDSEQSAIWQCLEGKDKAYLKKIYLTASGGPLKDLNKNSFAKVTLEHVLRHPCWRMGKKITVDSATLMNKGLEIIETMNLFQIDVSKIEVLIHPEVIVHSMVEFVDRTILAQLSSTDMRLPIQHALSYPKRLSNGLAGVDFLKLKTLSFEKPNTKKFPCLRLAYQAARIGGVSPCVLNAADEVAVDAFLNKKINFTSIPRIIEKVLSKIPNISNPSLKDILKVHSQARQEAMRLTNN